MNNHHFRNVVNELKYNDEKPVFINDNKYQSFGEIVRNDYIKFKYIKQITQLLGINNTMDSTIIQNNNLENCYRYLQKNYDNIHEVFKLRNQGDNEEITNRKLSELMNKILSTWNNCKLFNCGQRKITIPSTKKRVKGIW